MSDEMSDVEVGLEGSAGALGPLLRRRLRAERSMQPSCDTIIRQGPCAAPVTLTDIICKGEGALPTFDVRVPQGSQTNVNFSSSTYYHLSITKCAPLICIDL